MANSITDVFAAMQNGVIALGKFQRQLTGSFNNISAQLATKAPSSGVVTTIAGNSGAFTLNGPSGITNTINDIELSQASTSQFGAVQVDGASIIATAGVISLNALPITNSLSSDVALSNISSYFDGPSIAQGSSGTWFASGTVTCLDSAGAANIRAKLWDGATIIASCQDTTSGANVTCTLPLSGFITSPAANLRISVRDITATTGKILSNQTGNSKDSTLTAIRIG